MTIQWYGVSCFKIQTKNNQQEATIVCDPFDVKTGLKMPKIQADIVTVSHNHDDHNALENIKGEPIIINTPGEFETKDIMIYGIPSFHDDKSGKERGLNTIYKIITEEISIVHLGDIGQTINDEILERLGNVDILLVPVGGIYTIGSKEAIDIISKVEPRIVIPMHYKIPNLAYEMANADDFLKNSGFSNEKIDKFKISKKDIAQENTKIIILNPSA